jgi:hypothetical protein
LVTPAAGAVKEKTPMLKGKTVAEKKTLHIRLYNKRHC